MSDSATRDTAATDEPRYVAAPYRVQWRIECCCCGASLITHIPSDVTTWVEDHGHA